MADTLVAEIGPGGGAFGRTLPGSGSGTDPPADHDFIIFYVPSGAVAHAHLHTVSHAGPPSNQFVWSASDFGTHIDFFEQINEIDVDYGNPLDQPSRYLVFNIGSRADLEYMFTIAIEDLPDGPGYTPVGRVPSPKAKPRKTCPPTELYPRDFRTTPSPASLLVPEDDTVVFNAATTMDVRNIIPDGGVIVAGGLVPTTNAVVDSEDNLWWVDGQVRAADWPGGVVESKDGAGELRLMSAAAADLDGSPFAYRPLQIFWERDTDASFVETWTPQCLDLSEFEDCLYAGVIHFDSVDNFPKVYRIEFDGTATEVWSAAGGSSTFMPSICVNGDGSVWWMHEQKLYRLPLGGVAAQVVYGAIYGHAHPWVYFRQIWPTYWDEIIVEGPNSVGYHTRIFVDPTGAVEEWMDPAHAGDWWMAPFYSFWTPSFPDRMWDAVARSRDYMKMYVHFNNPFDYKWALIDWKSKCGEIPWLRQTQRDDNRRARQSQGNQATSKQVSIRSGKNNTYL